MAPMALLNNYENTNNGWQTAFNVKHYMFCHPETVVLRRGRPRVLRWQHLLTASNISLCVRLSSVKKPTVESIALYARHCRLELLDPFAKMLAAHHLSVTWLDAWIGFKWTTLKGNTHFQIMLSSPAEAACLVQWLENSRCHIERKQIDLYGSTEDDDAEATLVDNPVPKDLGIWKGCSSQELMPITSGLGMMSQEVPDHVKGFSQPNHYQEGSLTDPMPVSQTMAIAAPALATAVASISTLSTAEPEVSTSIDPKRSLQLKVDSYAFAAAEKHFRRWMEGPKWFHVGLVSNLYLSLVPPSSGAKEPCALLVRGPKVLAEFVLRRKLVRAYYDEGILGLRQRGVSLRRTSVHVQLHMRSESVETALKWLAFWNVQVEDPNGSAVATETTHLSSGWNIQQQWSVNSSTSRVRPSSRTSLYVQPA